MGGAQSLQPFALSFCTSEFRTFQACSIFHGYTLATCMKGAGLDA